MAVMTHIDSAVLNEVYFDRNQAVQLAAFFAEQNGIPVWLGQDPEHPHWPVLYIELPTGQIGWHIPERDVVFYPYPRVHAEEYDGHDTEEKRQRIADYLRHQLDAERVASNPLAATDEREAVPPGLPGDAQD